DVDHLNLAVGDFGGQAIHLLVIGFERSQDGGVEEDGAAAEQQDAAEHREQFAFADGHLPPPFFFWGALFGGALLDAGGVGGGSKRVVNSFDACRAMSTVMVKSCMPSLVLVVGPSWVL